MTTVKEIIKRLTPPIFLDWARAFAGSRNEAADPGWEFAGTDWPEDISCDELWRRPEVVSAARHDYLATVSRLNNGAALADTAESHNTYMTFAYALARACAPAGNARALRVLDFGGGCGAYGDVARSLMPEFEFEWHVIEMPSLCDTGREVNRHCTFHDRDGALPHSTYDFALASGSLQYCRDWRGELAKLTRAANGPLLITRLPVSNVATVAVIQNVTIGSTSARIAHWVFGVDDLLRAAGRPLRRKFHLHGPSPIRGTDSSMRFAGYLFDGPENA